MTPAKERIRTYAGDTIQRRITVTDAAGDEIDLSSHTVVAAVVNSSGSAVLSLTEGSGITVTGGKIDWTITDEQTDTLGAGTFTIAIKIKHSDGREFTVGVNQVRLSARIVD